MHNRFFIQQPPIHPTDVSTKGNGHINGGGDGEDRSLEQLLQFPARVHIKAVGKQSNRFEALVHSIVGRHIDPTDLLAATTRQSSGGKYISVTLTINATSRAQLDEIYRELSDCKDVLIAL